MNINILPDMSLASAPFTTVLGNALKVASTANSDSIIQYSAPARIEPITLIDAALGQYESLYGILGTINNLLAAYYMQGASGVINVSAMRLLREVDSLKPDRNMNAAIFDFVEQSAQKAYGDTKSLPSRVEGKVLEIATESMQLPRPGQRQADYNVMITEAEDGKVVMKIVSPEEMKKLKQLTDKAATDLAKKEYDKQLAAMKASGNVAATSKTTMMGDLLDTPNLAVGRVFEVSADYGQGVVTIQVMVVLKTLMAQSSNMIDIYATGGEMRTFKERWHGWRSGQLRFLEDIIFCQDLIENHKRTAIKDSTGTYLLNRERDTANRVSALLSGKASIGTASAVSVISKQTLVKLEAAIGGKMADFGTREKVFKRTYVMLFVVVDPEWDMITVYHRGIPKPTTLPVAEFTRAKSKGGSDVADIVKLFLSGTAPTL